MAIIGTAVTLQDFSKRLDANGKIEKGIIEVLNQTNEILEDMLWVEGNLPTGYKSTIRNGLPSVAWRMLNYGVPVSKSETTQVTDTCGMLEAFSQVDKDLAELNGNSVEWRLSEEKPFLESMNQTMAHTLFYGDTTVNAERFVGLAPRYSKLTGSDAGTKDNIINGGGSGSNNTSIWLVCWGDNTAHGIYPKGTKAGLTAENLGLETVTDANGGLYRAFRSHFQWKCGLTVRDWRYVVRIANIDVTALTKNASAGADLIDLLIQMVETPPNLNLGRPVIYCNKTIRSFLRRQIANKNNVHLSIGEVAGKKVIQFDEIPVRRCDQIGNNEAAVV